VRSHLKTQRALLVLLGHALFGDQRLAQDFIDRHFASASENFWAAAWLSSTLWWPSRWYTLTSLVASSVTPFRFLTPSEKLRSPELSTTRTVRPASRAASAFMAVLVLGSPRPNAETTFNSPSRTFAERAERSAPTTILRGRL